MRRPWLLLVALLAGLLPAADSRAEEPGPSVLVYGDSLVDESSPYLDLVFRDVAGVRAQVVGQPGGAVCDALPRMREDARRFRPAAVVLAFSGNAFTPCMRDERGRSLTGDAWVAKYHADLVEAVRIFRPGAPTVWLGTYPTVLLAEKRGTDDQATMNALAARLAAQNPRVRVADSGAALLLRGEWTRTLHCLPKEPCQGGPDLNGNWVNVVRSYDTAHFCPTPLTLGGDCPVHSSGALRFAVGLVRPALEVLGRWDQARADGTMAAGWPGEAGR